MTNDSEPADDTPPPRNDLAELRAALFATLRGVRDGAIDLDRARAVNALAGTLIDSARVEVEYRRVVDDAAKSTFLEGAAPAIDGHFGRMVHKLKG